MFPPKGHKPGDSWEVIRAAAETCPLKCKNHDNKTLAGERKFPKAKNSIALAIPVIPPAPQRNLKSRFLKHSLII